MVPDCQLFSIFAACNIKAESKKNLSKKNKIKRENVEKEKRHATFIPFSPKVKTILGLLGILVAAFMFLAIFSYFFTWKIDQAKVLSLKGSDFIPQNWSNNTIQINNLMGKLGAKVAHYLVYEGLGLGAFIFPFVLFLYAFRLVFERNFIWHTQLYLSTTVAIWSSIFFGFCVA